MSWEQKLGYLKTEKCLVGWRDRRDTGEVQPVLQLALGWLAGEEEVRVKEAAGECLGAVCAHYGLDLDNNCLPRVLQLARTHLERKIEPDKEDAASGKLMDRKEWKNLAAWKDLDIVLSCLQIMLDSPVSRGNRNTDTEVLDLVITCLTHGNRFVRDSGYKTCASLLRSSSDQAGGENNLLRDQLSAGLSDSWAQVRLSACQAAREFLLSMSASEREEHLPALLPRLCLNRYFPAEAVRRQAQAAWRAVCGDGGRDLLARHVTPAVEYYTASARSDSPSVREAACLSISELVTKLDPATVCDSVPALLDSLSPEDSTWQVRDAASVAASCVIRHHPQHPHLAQHTVDTLLTIFLRHLQDPVSPVRQGAAVCLANTVRALGGKVLTAVTYSVREGLRALRDQAEAGGSLEPWQVAEGSVHTVAELSKIKEHQQVVSSLLPDIFQSCQYKHYPCYLQYCSTVCRRLAEIATNIDKRYFKPHLELSVIFVCLEGDSPPATAAAGDCLKTLGRILGPNILRGRVENFNPNWLPLHDRVMSGASWECLPTIARPIGSSQPIEIPRANNCDAELPSLGGTPPT